MYIGQYLKHRNLWRVITSSMAPIVQTVQDIMLKLMVFHLISEFFTIHKSVPYIFMQSHAKHVFFA